MSAGVVYRMREWTCEDCGETGMQTGPGRLRRRCLDCATVRENQRKRAWERSHEPPARCVDCASPLAIGSAHKGFKRCVECAKKHRRVQRVEIERMWNEGRAIAEIASALGRSVNSTNVTIVLMRREGWDMPYRYAVRDGKRVAA